MGGRAVSLELINFRLAELEADRVKAAQWRETTTASIARIEGSVDKALALGERRMNEIDKHLESTDTAVTAADEKASAAHKALRDITIEAKSDPKAFYTAIGSAIVAIAGSVVAYFKGTP